MTGVGVTLDDGFDSVSRQHLQRRALGGAGQRVRVLAHVERSVRALAVPVLADGLGDSQDVGLGERAVERRTAVPAGAEADQLVGVTHVGPALVVSSFELRRIDEQILRCRFAGEGGDGHETLPFERR
jgi:hypothetical protein